MTAVHFVDVLVAILFLSLNAVCRHGRKYISYLVQSLNDVR